MSIILYTLPFDLIGTISATCFVSMIKLHYRCHLYCTVLYCIELFCCEVYFVFFKDFKLLIEYTGRHEMQRTGEARRNGGGERVRSEVAKGEACLVTNLQ